MTTPLPGTSTRGRTYAFMAGVVATALTLSVGLPLVLADRPDQLASAPGADAPLALPDGSATGALPSVPGAAGTLARGAGPAGGTNATTRSGASSSAAGAAGGGTPGAGPAPEGGAAAGLPGGPAGPPGGAGTVARTASDQGVTPTTITLGVFLVDFGRANDIGAGVTGYSPAQQQRLAQAFADETNSRGGIGGRRLRLAFEKVDILDQQTMRDACTNFSGTDKVFAVTQVLGVYGDAILTCARDLRLPYLANDGAVSSYYPASRGYVFTTQPSTLRTQVTMVRRLAALGELRGRTVGFLHEDGYLLPDNDATFAELRRQSVAPVRGVVSSSDATLALRQIPTVAQDMCAKGVKIVVLAINSLYGAQFVQNMSRFGCRPAYAVSDFDFALNGDAFPQAMPDQFFDRALAVTASRTGEGRTGRPEPAHDARCRTVVERRTGTRLDRNATDSAYVNAVTACTLQELFARGVLAAGPNPTRRGFVDMLARTGGFDNGNYGPSTFAPGKTDGADAVRITRGLLSCKCWRPQTDFLDAAG